MDTITCLITTNLSLLNLVEIYNGTYKDCINDKEIIYFPKEMFIISAMTNHYFFNKKLYIKNILITLPL